MILAAVLTPLPGLLVSLITYDGLKLAHVSLLVPVAVGFGAAMLYVHGRARIAKRWKGRSWNGVQPVLLRAALLGTLALPMIVAAAAAFELQDARVCFRPTAQGTTRPPYDGFYVANTKDFAYIGESGPGTRRIRQFPAISSNKSFTTATCSPRHADSRHIAGSGPCRAASLEQAGVDHELGRLDIAGRALGDLLGWSGPRASPARRRAGCRRRSGDRDDADVVGRGLDRPRTS